MAFDIPDDDPDDRPRPRRRDDRDPDDRPHPRPRRPRPADGPPPVPARGLGRLVLMLGGLTVLGLFGCCGGGYFLFNYFATNQVEILDASRDKTPSGGTSRVTVTVRLKGNTPGGMIRGEHNFMFKAGSRQSVHAGYRVIGGGGGEIKHTFFTHELADQPGPVEFWVERRDGDSVGRVSPIKTIP